MVYFNYLCFNYSSQNVRENIKNDVFPNGVDSFKIILESALESISSSKRSKIFWRPTSCKIFKSKHASYLLCFVSPTDEQTGVIAIPFYCFLGLRIILADSFLFNTFLSIGYTQLSYL